MSFEKSYDEWINLAKEYGWTVKITKSPEIRIYSGHNTFVAKIEFSYRNYGVSYSIYLDFNYSTGTKTTDKNTLYSIWIGGK